MRLNYLKIMLLCPGRLSNFSFCWQINGIINFDKSSNKAERQLQVLIYGILALNRLFSISIKWRFKTNLSMMIAGSTNLRMVLMTLMPLSMVSTSLVFKTSNRTLRSDASKTGWIMNTRKKLICWKLITWDITTLNEIRLISCNFKFRFPFS